MKSAITIGNFDGVHRGHRALVSAVTDWRRSQSDADAYRSVVVTFEPHPVEVLKPGTVVPRLTPLKDKIHLLQNLGIDEVLVVPFTEEFARTPAREFFDKFLVEGLKMGFLAVGHNFYFGQGRQGTPGKLIDWCEELHLPAHLVDPVEADGLPISSTRIRTHIQDGQLVAGSRLLGRDYSIAGEVVHGDKRGRTLGFPTANILPLSEGVGSLCLPQKGVYLSAATVDGRTFPSITNVGVKPTVHKSAPLTIETHLLDFEGDLYGKVLTVEFRDRLRSEMKFASIAELQHQIQADTELARSKLRAF